VPAVLGDLDPQRVFVHQPLPSLLFDLSGAAQPATRLTAAFGVGDPEVAVAVVGVVQLDRRTRG
jgi:hypothetical protein